jgi:methyltransferase (TIGR00027 family)
METARPDALFRDPYAQRLAGEQGEAIVDQMKRGRAMAWAMIVRTAVFDELILRTVARDGVDLILNLAAGLDTRAWRLALPPTLRWVDVDLPDMLRYKTEMLQDERTACQYEAIPTDLTDSQARSTLFTRLGAEASRALVVTEGLLVYLTPEQVSSLATDLYAQKSFRWWLIDIVRPKLLQMINRQWGAALRGGNAPFRFAPAEGTAFFKPLGWREIEFRSNGEEARRLHREMRGMWLFRFIMRFYSKARREEMKGLAGTVLLARDDAF